MLSNHPLPSHSGFPSHVAIMTAPVDNQAAWWQSAQDKHFTVAPAPAYTPADDEVVIKVAYVAINPSEWKVRQPIPWMIRY
jgi:hypothetical protein